MGRGWRQPGKRRRTLQSVTMRNPARPVWAGGWQAPSFHPAPTACGQDLSAPGGWGDHKALFLAHLVPSKSPLQPQRPILMCHPQQEPYTHVHSGTLWGPRRAGGWAETAALVDTGQQLTGPITRQMSLSSNQCLSCEMWVQSCSSFPLFKQVRSLDCFLILISKHGNSPQIET